MSITSQAEETANVIPGDIYDYLVSLTRQATATYLAQEGIAIELEQLPINLSFSANASFGDYSVPLMSWAKILKRPPVAIAQSIAAILQDMQAPAIAEISVTNGYLNFRLNRPAVGRGVIERVLDAGADFGQNDVGTGTKVVIEHTAINSNKAAHVGHLRNSCLGDTLVRMLRSQGYNVEANNYIDDTGVQVADVVVAFVLLQEGLLELPDGNDQLPGESFDYYCSRLYVAVGRAYDRQPELLERRKAMMRAIEHGEEPYTQLAADLSHKIVRAHLATMARLNISYDLLTWESAIIGAGLWKRTFEMLRDRGVLEHPEEGPAAGCWIVPFGNGNGDAQSDEGEQRMSDKILVKSDGTATYTGKDIAYQLWKFGLSDNLGVEFHFVPWGRQHDGRLLWTMLDREPEEGPTEADPRRFGHGKRVITVIDVRQSYLQQVVYESLRRLGYVEQADNSTHFAYEVVTLSAATAASLGVDTSDGHESYAMSGRKGIEVKADDLINKAIAKMQEAKPDLPVETAAQLAASAIRYFMVRFNQQQIITLDIDEALRANGDTGVYLQYAYARANSILRKLDESGYTIPDQLDTLPAELEQSEWELLRHIDAYPRTLADNARQLAPGALAAYVFDLAAHFSGFYEHTPPILKESDEAIKAFRAQLVRAAVQTMGNALRLMGFVPLERI